MKRKSILIVDDHAIVRAGLRAYFENTSEFVVLGEAANGNEALEFIAESQPDVALLDISMPLLDGVETTREIRKRFPGVGVLIITIHNNGEFVRQMIAAGADGYVLKDAERSEVLEAVRTVATGGRYLNSQVSGLLLDAIYSPRESESREPSNSKNILTPREMEVLRCVARGMTNQEAGEQLFISPLTVHTHRNNIMQKLDIHETAGLTRYAIRIGLVEQS